MADLERGLKINELAEKEELSTSNWLAIDDGINTYKTTIGKLNQTGSETARGYAEAAEQSALDAHSYYMQAQTAVQACNDSINQTRAQLQGYVDEAEDAAAYADASRQRIESLITSDYAKTAKSYAVGDTGYRDGEETDNAKYYCEQAKDHTDDALESANTAIGAAIDAVTASEAAAAILPQIMTLLTVPTFTVDFTTGYLMFDRNEVYDFEINETTGNLEWEVVVA